MSQPSFRWVIATPGLCHPCHAMQCETMQKKIIPLDHYEFQFKQKWLNHISHFILLLLSAKYNTFYTLCHFSILLLPFAISYSMRNGNAHPAKVTQHSVNSIKIAQYLYLYLSAGYSLTWPERYNQLHP